MQLPEIAIRRPVFATVVSLILMLIGVVPSWPHSRGWGYGPSGLLGLVVIVILILVVMILPIITAISRDALRQVPVELRQGAYGVGTTRWDAIMLVILPAAISGITGGVRSSALKSDQRMPASSAASIAGVSGARRVSSHSSVSLMPSSGRQKYSISICSNSRDRKM